MSSGSDPVRARWRFNVIGGWVAGLLAIACLVFGVATTRYADTEWRALTGKVIVALWVLVPPVFFWVEWTFFTAHLTHEQRAEVEHSHNLSRNIWLAVVIVLGALFKVFDLGVVK